MSEICRKNGGAIRLCRAVGTPQPEHSILGGSLTTIWRKLFFTKDLRQETSVKRFGKPAKAILELIRTNPEITIPELAVPLGKSERAIEMQISKLRDAEAIARVGPVKGGHWEVLE